MKHFGMYDLKWMAKAGYQLGLTTIGEVYEHMRSHYDAYFLIDTVFEQIAALEEEIAGHELERVTFHLTPEEIKEIDDELDRVLANSAAQPPQGEESPPDVPVRRMVVPSQDWVTRVTSDHPEQGDDGLHPPAEDDINTIP